MSEIFSNIKLFINNDIANKVHIKIDYCLKNNVFDYLIYLMSLFSLCLWLPI